MDRISQCVQLRSNPMSAQLSSLQGTRVIVTGGLGVLGRSACGVLAGLGARVVVLDRAPQEDVAGSVAVFGGVDLGDEAATAAAVARAEEALGGLNALVNVAGGFAWETVAEGSLATWDRMYQMNVRSAVAATRAALPALLRSTPAVIVNVGSLAAGRADAGMGAYAAAKSGVARFTEALAEEMKGRGLRVNAVLPSIIDTPTNRADMPQADASRWVPPASLAGVIAFLLSSSARDITGACLPVAGRV